MTRKQVHIVLKYTALVAVNLLYACVTIFTKYASQHSFMSAKYLLGLCGAVSVMGIYAVCWQQILRRVELSTAYMFKGTSLVFVMLLAFALFGEQITLHNIIGACAVMAGIVLYALE